MTIKSPVKLFALSFGAIFALTQVGLVGMIAEKMQRKVGFPSLPVGPYTSYRVVSNADGSYDMLYRANDPLVMSNVKKYNRKRGGFLGSKKRKLYKQQRCIQWMERFIMVGQLVALVHG